MSDRRRLASLVAAWAVPAFAVLTLVLGAAGWLAHGQRFDEALYRAVALFDNNNDTYDGPPGSTDWRFLVGRWTGIIAVFGAAGLAIGALLHERLVLALVRGNDDGWGSTRTRSAPSSRTRVDPTP